VTTAISKNAFAKIAGAAGTLVKGMDFKSMLAPMNPMMHAGDENGEDCLFARLSVDDFKMSNATISLVPVVGGLSFSAKIDGLDIPGRVRYAVACADGNNTVRVTASSVTIKGTLTVTADGMNGFKTDLASPTIQISGLNIAASGLPGEILDILPLDTLIEKVAPTAARLFMGPMVNKALGGLGGPKELTVLGKTISVLVDPTEIIFDADGGLVTLDMQMLIKGTESSKGFVFTDNGIPTLDPGNGLELGLADDLANSIISQAVATGLLNLHLEAHGGTFDGLGLEMTSPPMISGDPANGMMRLVLPDVMGTFTHGSTPVGKAAVNGLVELKITPSADGLGLGLELGKPTIQVDILDEIANQTLMSNQDLATAVELSLGARLDSLSEVLGAIPLPALPAGIVLKDISVSSDEGYVMAKGALQ
jgi:hypothetical protein